MPCVARSKNSNLFVIFADLCLLIFLFSKTKTKEKKKNEDKGAAIRNIPKYDV